MNYKYNFSLDEHVSIAHVVYDWQGLTKKATRGRLSS
jgi:hypothetical protein